jgi:hypothetical protein
MTALLDKEERAEAAEEAAIGPDAPIDEKQLNLALAEEASLADEVPTGDAPLSDAPARNSD